MSIDFRMRGRLRTRYLLAGGTPTYPVSFSRRGRLRTRTSIAGSMLLGYSFTTLSYPEIGLLIKRIERVKF